MKFCDECNNMLYLRLDENNRGSMLHYCRHCGFTKPAESFCFEKTSVQKINPIEFINPYTHLDPTLPHTHNMFCPNTACPSNQNTPPTPDVVIFKPKLTSLENIFICYYCQHNWTNMQASETAK